MRYTWRLVTTYLLICLLVHVTPHRRVAAAVSSTATTAAVRTVLDLSYRLHLPPSIADDIIQNYTDRKSLEVDISGLYLGDRGINQIAKTLLTWSSADPDAERGESYGGALEDAGSLFLDARTNGLTPRGVADFLRTMISPTTNSSSTTGSEVPAYRQVRRLDLGWNHLHSEAPGIKTFCKVLQELISLPRCCPTELRLDNCGLGPAACRAIGMGLMQRYIPFEPLQRMVGIATSAAAATTAHVEPLSLYACGNPAIGDAGVAALAAALRVVVTSRLSSATPISPDRSELVIFDRLDLSACDIGDAGVEALAVALESIPSPFCCIRHLDLSSNHITAQGAEILARAIQGTPSSSAENKRHGPKLYSLDLSNNNLGDRGGKALSNCLDHIPVLVLRSCHIHADGAKAFGAKFRAFAERRGPVLSVDLSGNPLGILRGKSKPDGGKYSASHLKSKASATASSYMNQGISFLRKGLKEVGVDFGLGISSAESDDEEEKRASSGGDTLLSEEVDPARARCGLKAMSNAFLEKDPIEQHQISNDVERPGSTRKIRLGLRHCFIDHAGASALAEMKIYGKQELNLSFDFDVSLNPVLEEEMVLALHGKDDERLQDMAEEHAEKMRILRESQERAANARAAAAARSEPEEDTWNIPNGINNQDEWDSDADYDDEGDDV